MISAVKHMAIKTTESLGTIFDIKEYLSSLATAQKSKLSYQTYFYPASVTNKIFDPTVYSVNSTLTMPALRPVTFSWTQCSSNFYELSSKTHLRHMNNA